MDRVLRCYEKENPTIKKGLDSEPPKEGHNVSNLEL